MVNISHIYIYMYIERGRKRDTHIERERGSHVVYDDLELVI